MSIWGRIINQPGFEKIKTLYNDNFPLEVRFVCAQWIEERIKADQYIDINDPQFDQRAANFLHNLIQQLEQEKAKYKKPEDISMKYRIDEAIRTFTQNIYNPVPLYRQIREALMCEQHFLENCNDNPQMAYMDSEAFEISDKLKQIQQIVILQTENCSRYKHELEQYMLRYTEGSKRIQEFTNMPPTPEIEERRATLLEEYKHQICSMTESINARRVDLYTNIRNILDMLNEVQKVVIHKRLGKWQRDQALAGNGAPLPLNTLDEIQQWFEDLANLIWTTRTLIDTIRKTNIPFPGQNAIGDVFEAAYREVTTLLQNLIVSGFIVEKQPPQVMKTNTRFAATVRLLLANISIHLNNPFVSVSILSGKHSVVFSDFIAYVQ